MSCEKGSTKELRDLAFQDVEAFFLPTRDVGWRPPPGGTMASHVAYLPFVSSPVTVAQYTSPTTAIVRPSDGARRVGWCVTLGLSLMQRIRLTSSLPLASCAFCPNRTSVRRSDEVSRRMPSANTRPWVALQGKSLDVPPHHVPVLEAAE